MKKISRIIFIFILFIIGINYTYAEEKNLVNIYLFYSDTCPHCHEELTYLDKFEEKYDNVRIYKYEIGNSRNAILLDEVASLFDTQVSGVPFTIIGDKYFKGFSYESYYDRFVASIEYYLTY